MKKFLVTMCLGAFAFAAAAPDWNAAGRDWWKHIEYLASDELEGRNVGSKGFEKAAQYVSAQFEQAGLQPANKGKYFQPVEFTESALNESESSLVLVRDGKSRPVTVGEEAFLGHPAGAPKTIEAPVVFAGYGLSIPEANWDDLKGLPVKGAIVAYLQGGPKEVSGNLRSHYSSQSERWKALQAKGAVGTLVIPNPKTMEVPWARQAESRRLPTMMLADAKMQEAGGAKFSASWNPAKTEPLFEGSNHSLQEILSAADQDEPLPHFEVPVKLKATVVQSRRPIHSENVVGLKRGSDPKLKNEYVVLSAHLDHLGVGKSGAGDRIYNGAMDDASGVASLIEVAKALSKSSKTSKRSIVFIAVTGEEKGEQGSRYFAERPTVEGKLVADINMDMYLPLFPLKILEVQGVNESSLGEDIRAVASANGVQVQADKEPNRNRFIRSDQYSFIKKGVPSLAFKFGYNPGDPEEKLFQAWYKDRYHGVADDLSQPVDKAGAAKFNAILLALLQRVADQTEAPTWKDDSFFKRFAKSNGD